MRLTLKAGVEYLLIVDEKNKKREYKRFKGDQNCLECGKKLKSKGSDTRGFRDSDGDSYSIRIRKFFCKICSINFSEIPDCFEERSWYPNYIKEEATSHPEKFKGGPSNVTLWRWRKNKKISEAPRNEMQGGE